MSRQTMTPRRPASLARYTALTLAATPVNLVLLAGTLAATNVAPAIANLLVGTVMTIPSYVACTRWVWQGTPQVRGRARQFWLASTVNIALASATMWGVTMARTVPRPVLTIVPLGVYSVTWSLRYLWLDRRLFATHHRVDEQLEVAALGNVASLGQKIALDTL